MSKHSPASHAKAASDSEAQSKVRALAALVELGDASPLGEDELRGLLEDLAHDPPQALAELRLALTALQVIERLDAPPDDEAGRA